MSEYPADHGSKSSFVTPPALTSHNNFGLLSPDFSQTNPAKWIYQKLAECIHHFERSLDDKHENGALPKKINPQQQFPEQQALRRSYGQKNQVCHHGGCTA